MSYSIREVEKLSQIKAHTLRIWEQRYGIIVPHRTSTQIRFYDDAQLKQILNIALLLKNGYKISKVAAMHSSQIAEAINKLGEENNDPDFFYSWNIEALLIAMIDLDEEKFDQTMEEVIRKIGFEQSMLLILIPFLTKIGMLWSLGEVNVAQEHFMANLIRRRTIVEIDKLPRGKHINQEKFILFLPENEWHEIGLLFAKYAIVKRGFHVIYLGQSMPFNDLEIFMQTHNPTHLFTYFTAGFTTFSLQKYLNRFKENPFSNKEIWVSGPLMHNPDLQLAKHISHLKSYSELIQRLDQIS